MNKNQVGNKDSMRKKQIDMMKIRTWLAIPIIGIALFITACGGTTAPKATPAGGSAAPVPIAQAAPTKGATTNATPPAKANPTAGNLDCLTIGKANLDFGRTM